MKIAFSLLLAILSYGYMHAQTNQGIHTIVIYEAGKDGFIQIDRTGKTNFGQQLDLSELNKNIETYLTNEGYSFQEANDNPPPEASYPTNGKKNTYITVILLDDYKKDRNFLNVGSYVKAYLDLDLDFIEYDILQLFSQEDQMKLKTILKDRK